ncbi:hypothetical protein B0H10DRAFT_2115209 [Mycena sp. CBHHK59/15]|nr:hypothetical protein B0H10DRAFT_2115209 [Mycena sp. CBHHK59/15]
MISPMHILNSSPPTETDQAVLDTLTGLWDEALALPFATEDDEDLPLDLRTSADYVERRDRTNFNAVQSWKALRVSQKPRLPYHSSLSMFPSMHVDIVFEVLGHLHPIDLMHVSRTSKMYRELLHSPTAGPIWRNAFVGRDPLPMCPVEICGRRWAKLLFGPRKCDECGKPDTSPDYTIQRRLCSGCMNSKLFNGVPNYGWAHEVNTLVAKTFRTDGSVLEADSDVGRIWPEDGTIVALEYERLKADDTPGGEAAFREFIEKRKEVVAAIEQRVEECNHWYQWILDACFDEDEKQLVRVCASVTKRLIKEGHDLRDVQDASIRGSSYLQTFPRLTSKRWHKARPYVLPLVCAARDARLEMEHTLLVKTRKKAVCAAVVKTIRSGAAPATWAYHPPEYTIESFATFAGLINDESDEPLTADAERLAAALADLPALVELWRVEKQTQLASLLLAAAQPPDLRTLDLATSVFTCLGSWIEGCEVRAGRSLIGWEGAGTHLRCGSLQNYHQGRLHFCPEGSAAARELVKLVDLDPTTATAAEMDGVDARFLCGVCPGHGGGRKALLWRECVLHAIECRRLPAQPWTVSHATPFWQLLSPEGASDVRRREDPDPYVLDFTWICNLCPAHYDRHVKRADAEAHVRDVHEIVEPVEGEHFLWYQAAERTPRVPAMVSDRESAAKYRCNRCMEAAPHIIRLISLRWLVLHLQDKHGVFSPGESDWTRVARILRSSPVPGSGTASATTTE